MSAVTVSCARCGTAATVEQGAIAFCESCGEMLDSRSGVPAPAQPYGFGAAPPAPQGYATQPAVPGYAPPAQQGYATQPTMQSYPPASAPPGQQAYATQPTLQMYGAPQPAFGAPAPDLSYASQPTLQMYTGAPQAQPAGAAPLDPGYATAPGMGAYGAPQAFGTPPQDPAFATAPSTAGYGAPQAFGAPPPPDGGYAPPSPAAFGAPPAEFGAPPAADFGAPPAEFGAPPPAADFGAPPTEGEAPPAAEAQSTITQELEGAPSGEGPSASERVARLAGPKAERPVILVKLPTKESEDVVRKAALGFPATFNRTRAEGMRALVVRGLLGSQAMMLKDRLDRLGMPSELMPADQLKVGVGLADLKNALEAAGRYKKVVAIGVAAVVILVVGWFAAQPILRKRERDAALRNLASAPVVEETVEAEPPPPPPGAIVPETIGFGGRDAAWWQKRITDLRATELTTPTEERPRLRGIIDDTERKAKKLGIPIPK